MIAATRIPIRTIDPEDPYRVSSRGPEVVRVPEMRFLMVDGHGDPNIAQAYRDAIGALYALGYTLKFARRKETGESPRVGALEGLWWVDDMSEFTARPKADWRWTSMLVVPDWVTPEWFERARDEIRARKGDLPALADTRLERFTEGLCAQVLHVGPWSEEAPTIERLHAFIAELGGTFDGRREKHHELYLGDPRRTRPDRLRTIVRQPFEATGLERHTAR
jgi:hypothetical protein